MNNSDNKWPEPLDHMVFDWYLLAYIYETCVSLQMQEYQKRTERSNDRFGIICLRESLEIVSKFESIATAHDEMHGAAATMNK